MKILHTADWHLGKKLDYFSRLEEQKLVMQEIIEIADRQSVDLILIAGDLFDNFNPPTEAIDLFYQTLVKLSKNGERPVIAIAGNHDSPAFIDTPNSLARANGIVLIGYPKAMVQQFKLDGFELTHSTKGFIELKIKNIDFPVRIIHTAYASEVRLKEFLGEEKDKGLNEALATHWKLLADEFCDEKGVNLLMTHLYMNKKGKSILEEPDGEKPIKIGNADLVFSEAIPPRIQYTALGHLHGFNNIGSDEKPVIYSSSPLSYSFSEAGQQKFVMIVNAEPGENISFEKIPLQSGRQLVRKEFDDVEIAVEWLTQNPNTLVELTMISDNFMSAEDRQRILRSHDGIIYLIPKLKMTENEVRPKEEINLKQSEQELFKAYFQSKNKGQLPDEDLMDLLNEILNA